MRLVVPATSVKVLSGRKTLKKSSKAFTLKKLPKKAFTLRFEITLEDGRVVKGSRKFRACKKG